MRTHSKPPLIIGFVADLMFTSKIEMVAQHLDYVLIWVGSVAELERGGSGAVGRPAVSAEEPGGPAVSAEEPGGPAVSAEEPGGPAVSAEDPGGPALSAEEPGRPALSAEEPGRSALS